MKPSHKNLLRTSFFVGTLATGAYLSYKIRGTLIDKISEEGDARQDLILLLLTLLTSYPMVVAVFWIAYFFNSSIKRNRVLYEEYQHKESAATLHASLTPIIENLGKKGGEETQNDLEQKTHQRIRQKFHSDFFDVVFKSPSTILKYKHEGNREASFFNNFQSTETIKKTQEDFERRLETIEKQMKENQEKDKKSSTTGQSEKK